MAPSQEVQSSRFRPGLKGKYAENHPPNTLLPKGSLKESVLFTTDQRKVQDTNGWDLCGVSSLAGCKHVHFTSLQQENVA